jgi:signal transduction histidine kinase
VEELRRIQRNLWPSLLDDLGVLKTVQGFCRAYNEVYAGIRIEIDLGVEEADVPSRLRIVIYRIIQEAFNNIAKHSRANLATISLQKTESGFDLLITDNGSGFDPAAVSRDGPSLTGLGLSTMKERTELSGGIFSIDSMPGKGTSIRCSWTV